MASQLLNGEPKTGVPFDRARKPVSRGLHGRAAMARIQDHGLYVTVEPDRPVYLGLDVVVPAVS